MNDIQTKILANAIKLLDAINAQYAIVDPDGKQHGKLELKPKAPKKKRPSYEYGSVAAHVKGYLAKAMINTKIVVPLNGMHKEVVRSAICSYANKLWGNGSYTTHVCTQGIEFTRLDPSIKDIGLSDDPLKELLKGWE